MAGVWFCLGLGKFWRSRREKGKGPVTKRRGLRCNGPGLSKYPATAQGEPCVPNGVSLPCGPTTGY
jgi:hypothetical protein